MKIQSIVALTVVALAASAALQVVQLGAQTPARNAAKSAADAKVPTFSKDVAPILYKNCTTCHRAGEIGPMALVTYQDARPWANSDRKSVV